MSDNTTVFLERVYIRSPTGVEHSDEEIYGSHSPNAKLFEWIEMLTNENYYRMPYNSRSAVVRLLAKMYDSKSNVILGGFRSHIQASYVSGHTEDL